MHPEDKKLIENLTRRLTGESGEVFELDRRMIHAVEFMAENQRTLNYRISVLQEAIVNRFLSDNSR